MRDYFTEVERVPFPPDRVVLSTVPCCEGSPDCCHYGHYYLTAAQALDLRYALKDGGRLHFEEGALPELLEALDVAARSEPEDEVAAFYRTLGVLIRLRMVAPFSWQ
jgi:hypothetical protein